jgi:hypothetical protein
VISAAAMLQFQRPNFAPVAIQSWSCLQSRSEL